MPNKTIYVSEADLRLFDQAKELAGEALSSVISRALREYVARNQKKAQGMKDISIMIGKAHAESEKRFVGQIVGSWQGFSTDKQWWMKATIYRTQKGNWAVHLTTVVKASLLTNKKQWKESGDYLVNAHESQLTVGQKTTDFEKKLPTDLFTTLKHLMEKDETPVEYLDI
jgi:EXLDI family protein